MLTNLASGRPDAIEKQIAELFLDDEEEKEEPAAKLDVLIRGGSVVDGTGKPRFQADVGIRDGRIAHVGAAADATAELVIDAEGMIVAPGFLDARMGSTVRLQEGALSALNVFVDFVFDMISSYWRGTTTFAIWPSILPSPCSRCCSPRVLPPG